MPAEQSPWEYRIRFREVRALIGNAQLLGVGVAELKPRWSGSWLEAETRSWQANRLARPSIGRMDCEVKELPGA